MKFEKLTAFVLAMGLATAGTAETTIKITGSGSEQFLVSVDVQGDPVFKQTLMRNLDLSGVFRLAQNAPIKVTGQAGGTVSVLVDGKAVPGKSGLSMASRASDAKGLRTEARLLSDRMCEHFAQQKGFANDRIAFVLKNGKSEELCVGYPDGGDICQLTHDNKASVGPRWKNANTIYYTGYLNNAPQIFEIDAASGSRHLAYGFGGLTTGATVSPDGGRVAIILSKPFGNPELCLISPSAGSWTRLTTTKTANEGQPAWSPDGRKIVYVSDETRRQHLFIIDAATKDKRRLTSSASQNVDPDWGSDGRIAYTCRKGGQGQIAVITPAEGESSVRYVTTSGAWEHPSWSRNRRHLVAERDGVLYLIDTQTTGEEPVAPKKLFSVNGRCITPSWSR